MCRRHRDGNITAEAGYVQIMVHIPRLNIEKNV